jgi:hypothetical protein
MSKKTKTKVSWYEAEGRYSYKREEVRQLCTQHFGPEHSTSYNHATKKTRDNHGNWRLTFGGVLQFRYKKDITWFALTGSHLSNTSSLMVGYEGAAFYAPYIPLKK